jgi:chromosome segregation ATPase
MHELGEMKSAQEGMPDDHESLLSELRTMQGHVAEAEAGRNAAEQATTAAQQALAKLKSDIEAQRQATVARADYEVLRTEMEKTRNDLSTALSRYATLQQRFNSIDKAASIERLKAGLSQEEKAHGALRIQYRNLENKLYEAVGGRKRYETELKAVTKERDQLQTQIKSIERTSAGRVKVTLPPEIANPTLPDEAGGNLEPVTEEPAKPKRRVAKKKAPVVELPLTEESTPEPSETPDEEEQGEAAEPN